MVLHLTRTSSPLITWAGLTCWVEGYLYVGAEALVFERERWGERKIPKYILLDEVISEKRESERR